VFILVSSNKVYGDTPNELPLVELETRWDYARDGDRAGIDETMRIDRSRHSVFGAGKIAADLLTQEYGRTFGLRTHCLRAGCLTGPRQAGVQLHGFLSWLVRTQLSGNVYTIRGFKGKQVRDNIHSRDVALAIEAICERPGVGEAFNIGGGRENSCSILEAFEHVRELTGVAPVTEYVDIPRDGDHCCYISDMSRFRARYPSWEMTTSLDQIISELVTASKVLVEA
jgi:CDP-paratose 2-epimerase